jgi:hypothetical protein
VNETISSRFPCIFEKVNTEKYQAGPSRPKEKIRYKRENELTREREKEYIPRYPSLLADRNRGAQPNWASEFAIQGNTAAPSYYRAVGKLTGNEDKPFAG